MRALKTTEGAGTPAPAAKEPKTKKIQTLKTKFTPYTGPESLSDYSIVAGKVVYGEPRFFINRSQDNPKKFKLIAVYKKPGGVQRRLWSVLKPYDKPDHKAFMNQLKAGGIQIGF